MPSVSGGASPVRVASRTLNDAGIRALSTTPVVLVPATTIINYDPLVVPDVVFMPIAATVITKIVAGYTLGSGSQTISLVYSSDNANLASAKAPVITGLQTAGTWQTDLPCPPTLLPSGISITGEGGQPINGDWLDNALALASYATITGGDPANTLTVQVLYMAVPVT